MSIDKGSRVAHRSLDEDIGAARSGVVEDLVGEEPPRLVIASFEDTAETEAFDERELVNLGKHSDGPVILRPRHLLALARRRPVALALAFVFVLTAAIGAVALHYEWSLEAEAVAAGVVLALALIIIRRLQAELPYGK